MSQVFARRLGRIAFGMALLVGVAVLSTTAWHGSRVRYYYQHEFGAARLIGLTWLAAVIAGTAVRALASRVRWSHDGESLFAESVMIPAAGIALLLPITLHVPVALLVSDSEAFDFWVTASLWITGLAHLVFAATIAVRARQLVAGRPAITPGQIFVITVLTSCVPFVVLWAIPPLLVAITALPFVPMLHAMQRMIERERAELAAMTQALPRAIAVPARGA